MKVLLNRPAMMKYESLVSFFYRITKANNYATVAAISREIDAKLFKVDRNNFSRNQIKKIAEITLKNEDDFTNKTQNYFDEKIESQFARFLYFKRGFKFCPKCITDQYHNKIIWNLNTVTVCLQHKTFLADCCMSCKNPVSMLSLVNGKCINCNFSLLDTPLNTLKVSSPIYRSQKILQRYLSHFINRNEIAMKYSFNDLIELAHKTLFLLSNLESYLPDYDGKISVFIGKVQQQEISNYDFAIALGNVYWVYKDFPVNFHRLLDDFSNKGNFDKRKRHRRNFEELFINLKFLPIKHAYNDYWKNKAKKGEISKSYLNYRQELQKVFKKSYCTKGDLIKTGILTRDEVENLLYSNSIEVREINFGGLKQFVIKSDQMVKINWYKNQSSNLIRKKQAAKMLGVSIESLRRLVNKKVLKCYKNPLLKGELLKIDDVKKILSLSNNHVDETNYCIKFNEIINKYRCHGVTIELIVTSLIKGELKAVSYKKEPQLTDFIFEENALLKCLSKNKPENKYYNLTEVAKLLNVDLRMVKKMIGIGLIKPLVDGKTYLFNKKEIGSFIDEYIESKDAAEMFGIRRGLVNKWVRNEELPNYNKTISRTFLLKKNEVEEKVNYYRKKQLKKKSHG
ncbi:TniQ family protein [Virgibacillus sp. DJP39]|uniref:TniQ family protein n=1 Tax=Virgibacillus sp. DJP39 TaxID=3409790 RepID=UPI003BB50D77